MVRDRLRKWNPSPLTRYFLSLAVIVFAWPALVSLYLIVRGVWLFFFPDLEKGFVGFLIAVAYIVFWLKHNIELLDDPNQLRASERTTQQTPHS